MYNKATLNETSVSHRTRMENIAMRTKDNDLLKNIKMFVNDYCDTNGYGPTAQEVASEFSISRATAHRYLQQLESDGGLSRGRHGYESNAFAENKSMRSIAILGAVPCGPLTEVEEYVEGYVRLPESLIGRGKFFLLTASGNSMVGAGIQDGDLVLIRQQETADIGDIVVALVDNEVTLKRLGFDEDKKSYYLHPENRRMRDIYVDHLTVQGVAVKVLKDL